MRRRLSLRLFRYVLFEALPFIALTLLLLTTLILAQQVARQSELLFSSTASLFLTLRIIFSLLPGVLVITLPFSLLIGVLMALNRLASDSEIIALQASGLNLLRIAAPLLACGLAGAGASAYLTIHLMPRLITDAKAIRRDLLLQALTTPIKPQTFDTHFPNLLLYIRDIDRESGEWRGIFIVRRNAEKEGDMVVLTANRARLRMTQAAPVELELDLIEGLLLNISSHSPEKQTIVRFTQQEFKISSETPAIAQSIEKERSSQELSLTELHNRGSKGDSPLERRQAQVEWHKRLALPFACLALILVAIPLGTTTTRGAGRTLAFAVGFGLAVLYYLVLLAGQNLSLSGTLPAWLGVWLPNLIGLAGGLTATLNALPKRAPSFSSQIFSSKSPKQKQIKNRIKQRRGLSIRLSASVPLLPPPLISYLVLSEMIKYLGLTSVVLLFTSLVFTLFDLLPYLSRTQLGWAYAAVYLGYLAPQILYYVMPFAVLLALLISHGILARSNQITALLVGGVSSMRLLTLFLCCAAGATVSLFWLSETILPTSNREQDSRYNRIKGKPQEQAIIAFGQRWVQGEDGTIYAYQYNPTTRELLKTTAYYFQGNLLWRLLQVEETVPVNDHNWQIKQGWELSISPSSEVQFSSITPHSPLQLNVPDNNMIFTRVINEASKMNFFELRQYIRYLARLNAPTNSLRVDLEKKLAFPFSCLPLLAIAFPLALRNTKRRTLAGVGLSIIIGFTYWISAGLFESLGRQAFLPPGLSVWGPHALFVSVGIFLFFRLRN